MRSSAAAAGSASCFNTPVGLIWSTTRRHWIRGLGPPRFNTPVGLIWSTTQGTLMPYVPTDGFNTPVGLIWSTTRRGQLVWHPVRGFNTPVGLIWSTTWGTCGGASPPSVSIPQWVSSGVLHQLTPGSNILELVSIPQWVSSGVLLWLTQQCRTAGRSFQYPSGSHLEYYHRNSRIPACAFRVSIPQWVSSGVLLKPFASEYDRLSRFNTPVGLIWSTTLS